VLSQGVPRDAAVNFGTYQSFQWHRAVFNAVATLSLQQMAHVGVSPSRGLKLLGREIIFEEFQPM